MDVAFLSVELSSDHKPDYILKDYLNNRVKITGYPIDYPHFNDGRTITAEIVSNNSISETKEYPYKGNYIAIYSFERITTGFSGAPVYIRDELIGFVASEQKGEKSGYITNIVSITHYLNADYKCYQSLFGNQVDRISMKTSMVDAKYRSRDEYFRHSREFLNTLRNPGGRFHYYEFNPYLLPDTVKIDVRLRYKQNEKGRETTTSSDMGQSLSDVLDNSPNKNFIFIGEGGTGKTTALLDIWQKKLGLEKELPLFVALNEYNEYKEYKEDPKTHTHFIENYVMEQYSTNVASIDDPVILLLDGFNEVSCDPGPIVKEIKRLIKKANIRAVITSRPNLIEIFNWERFIRYEILPLTTLDVSAYLEGLGQPLLPSSDEEWLTNPMILTLYAKTCAIRRQAELKDIFDFKPDHSKGEIIYNFVLCQLAKLVNSGQIEELYSTYTALFLVAPYIAWKAEKDGRFWIKKSELDKLIGKYLSVNGPLFLGLAKCALMKLIQKMQHTLMPTLDPF